MITLRLVLYSVIFVVTAGIAVMGSLMSIRSHKRNATRLNQLLIYQQLFSYAYMFYGIWGNLVVIKILDDLQLAEPIRNKIMTIHPLLGLPFLCTAWFMLIQVFYGLTGKKWGRISSWFYFATCVLILPAVFFITGHSGWFRDHNSMFRVYVIIAAINLAIHLFLFWLIPWKSHVVSGKYSAGFRVIPFSYFAGVLLYSAGIWLTEGNHYIVALVTILFIFASNLLLPVYFTADEEIPAVITPAPMDDFRFFCIKYDISRREAEIILEVHAGKSNREIADSLFITLQTVKDHMHRIFTKTGSQQPGPAH